MNRDKTTTDEGATPAQSSKLAEAFVLLNNAHLEQIVELARDELERRQAQMAALLDEPGRRLSIEIRKALGEDL